VALIIILVICLKKRSYGEWKSMDNPSLGTWYYVHGGMILCTLLKLWMLWRNLLPPPLLHSLNIHNVTDLHRRSDCKYCCQVHCYEMFILGGLWYTMTKMYMVIQSIGREHVSCTWWYGVLGESMSVVHGDTECWERACQLYMVI
jgi:hypothetical protein